MRLPVPPFLTNDEIHNTFAEVPDLDDDLEPRPRKQAELALDYMVG